MQTLTDFEVLSAAGISELGEGPVWDHRTGCFHWVDIAPGRVLTLAPGTTQPAMHELGATVGFAVPTTDPNHLLAGRATGVVDLDLLTGRITPLCELSDDQTLRCNDGKCDPTGRLWAGVMPLDWGQMTGSFYSVTADGTVQKHLTEIGCSNGLAWDATKGVFYYIDSLKYRIDRHRWDPALGTIEFERTLVQFDPAGGLPDGMCIDAEGQLWVAFWNGGCVRRIDAKTGEWLVQLDLPARQITSCAFGGPDLDTLFITSAWTGLDDEQRATQPLAGAVFCARPGVKGLPVDCFALAPR